MVSLFHYRDFMCEYITLFSISLLLLGRMLSSSIGWVRQISMCFHFSFDLFFIFSNFHLNESSSNFIFIHTRPFRSRLGRNLSNIQIYYN